MSLNVKTYDFTIGAGQGSAYLDVPGRYFLVMSATGSIAVGGDWGEINPCGVAQGLDLEGQTFRRLIIKNLTGGAVSGTILIGTDGSYLNMQMQLSGSITVRPEAANGFYSTGAAIAANTADTIFTPAANANGAIVQYASALQCDGVNFGMPTFIYKASAPANCFDGTVVAMGNRLFGAAGAGSGAGCELSKDVFIPAGNGFYFITSYASGVTANNGRSSRYKLL
jgi:hypothetical protein